MGQKVSPIGLRLGINKTWKSRWFGVGKVYVDNLIEDHKIRQLVKSLPETKNAEVSEVEITRYSAQRVSILLATSRPGYLIGTKGANIDKLQDMLSKTFNKNISVKIKEVKKPDLDAQMIAIGLAKQLKSRGSFKKTIRQVAANAMRAGAEGIKIKLTGRLAGSELSRVMEHKERRVPLHTLRADIDYGFSEAFTTYGVIGVKVWVFKGEVFDKKPRDDAGQVVRRQVEKADERG